MMRNANGRTMWVSGLNATLLGLVCALTLGCGGRTHGVETGGETGFLEACGSDADCQSGLCACGVCSRTCEEETDCNDSRATCVSGAEACDGESRAVCLQKQVSSEDASVGFQTTGQSTSPGSEDCHGPGHYEAGKEGGYLPCCAGLTEVLHMGPVEGEDGPECIDLPLRIYACVEGTCGDGVCEVGEDVHCGCVDDCPGAAWGDDPGPAPTATGAPSVIEDGTDPPECGGFACENLRVSSPGQVQINVDLEGALCTTSCGEISPILYDLQSGLAIHGTAMCDKCPVAVPLTPPVCVLPSVAGRTWRGEVGFTDATCVSSAGNTVACQSAPTYLPPGRYRAELCVDPSYLDPITGEPSCFDPSASTAQADQVCATVEFDFPSAEPVVLRLNTLQQSNDAGTPLSTGLESGIEVDASVSLDAGAL